MSLLLLKFCLCFISAEVIVPDKNMKEVSETESVCCKHSDESHPIKDSETFMRASTLADGSEYIVVSDTTLVFQDESQIQDSEVHMMTAASAIDLHSPKSFEEENTDVATNESQEDAKVTNAKVIEAMAVEQMWTDISKLDSAVSSSYVVMEDDTKEASDSPVQAQNYDNFEDSQEIMVETPGILLDASSIMEENGNLSVGSVEVATEQQNIMASSATSSGVDSEKDEEGVMSEPEIVNPSNSSSDSSDTAWEILSDSESKGEN